MASFPPPPPLSPQPPGDDPGWGPPSGGYQPAYASWGARLLALIVDSLAAVPFLVAGFLLAAILSSISDNRLGEIGIVLGFVGEIGFVIWNLIRQGKTGQTIGKQAMGIRLVRIGQPGPPGVGLSIGRNFVHILDALPCYLGFLWPLWDDRRQTFADKILGTVVLRA